MPVASPPPLGGETVAPDVPRLAAGVALLGEMTHSGFREPPCLVRRADGQMLQLTPLLYRVLEAIDGKRDLAAIAAEVEEGGGRACAADDIQFLIDRKLRALGVLQEPDGSEPVAAKANPLLALRFRLVISKPELTRALTDPFSWLFNPSVVVVVLATFVAAVAWVFFGVGVGGGLRTILYDPRQLILVFALAALSAGFHEFGHAAACRYGGATPGAMGVGLYLVWPAFYTDVTDSYRLGRAGRLRTDLGGLYFNCVFTVVMAAAAIATGAEALLVLIPLQLLQMAHQLLPILRLDGYHILADVTGVPDLYARIRPTLRSALPGAVADPAAAALRPRVRRVVVAWIVVVVPLLVFAIGSAALAMPRVLATALDSFGLHWQAMHQEWGDGQVFAVLARLLSLTFLVIPIAGTFLIVERIAVRSFRFLWRRFDSPAGHTALVGVALALALALLAAWWPRGNYEPLGREDDLRFQQLPMVRALASQDLDELAATTAEGDSPFVSPGTGVAPEGSDATGAVVEGDNNLALAINTTDGASIFRLAFAIRFITDGVIDQTNTAMALASCTDCTTIALAFQVVLVFGDATDITPENRATAINVACSACLTFAAATQIILGFEGPVELTEEGRQRLDALHQELLSLEQRASSLDTAALAAEVEAAEEELLTILEEELVEVESEEEGEEDDSLWTKNSDEEADDEEGTSTTTSTSSTSSTSSSTSSTTSSSSSTTSTTAQSSD